MTDRGFRWKGRLGRFCWGICLECLISSVADSVKLLRDTRKLIVFSAVFAHLVSNIIAIRTTIAAQWIGPDKDRRNLGSTVPASKKNTNKKRTINKNTVAKIEVGCAARRFSVV